MKKTIDWIQFFIEVLEQLHEEMKHSPVIYIGKKNGGLRISKIWNLIKYNDKLLEQYYNICKKYYREEACYDNPKTILKIIIMYFARNHIEPFYSLMKKTILESGELSREELEKIILSSKQFIEELQMIR